MKKSTALAIGSAAATTAVALGVTLAGSQPVYAQSNLQVVMTGLVSPRGLALGPDGNLYVAEAGNGGTGTSILSGDGSNVSYGATSSISELNLSSHTQSRVLTGGPSVAQADGTDAVGISGIAFSGGQAFGVIGLGADPALISKFNTTTEAAAAHFDELVSFALGGSNTITNVANLGAFETANNPDGAELGSDPYNLAVINGGFAVADAGADDVLKATAGGVVSLLAEEGPQPTPKGFVGPPTYESVPTDVAVDPINGMYYFTELTGYPFTPGSANIYVYNPLTTLTSIAYTGFTTLTGLTFDPSGNLYALEYSTLGIAAPPSSGQVIEIAANGAQRTLLSTGLNDPTSILYGPNNTLYISNNGDSPTGGQVLALTAPEPGTLALVASAGLPLLPILRRKIRRTDA